MNILKIFNKARTFVTEILTVSEDRVSGRVSIIKDGNELLLKNFSVKRRGNQFLIGGVYQERPGYNVVFKIPETEKTEA